MPVERIVQYCLTDLDCKLDEYNLFPEKVVLISLYIFAKKLSIQSSNSLLMRLIASIILDR